MPGTKQAKWTNVYCIQWILIVGRELVSICDGNTVQTYFHSEADYSSTPDEIE